MAPSRRGEGAGGTGAPGLTAANGPDGGLVAIMEQKRNAHDQTIKVSVHHNVLTCKQGTCVSPACYPATLGSAACSALQHRISQHKGIDTQQT